ncbi:glucokinase [Marimonas lutisalis]|uniref:glucokinase n=1 Tax=Marimonas lutisalis TaxID=2545756 RepID=UPI0010F73D6B|nr:glucokinase [Marimonas lutisalis]
MSRNAPFLLADIGGTNSRLALSDGATLRPGSVRNIANDGVAGIETLLAEYLSDTGARPAAVCVAAAGPVQGDRVQLTNRDWSTNRAALARATGCDAIVLLNDLQAMGYALACPDIAGSVLSHTRLVVAIGTGINVAVAHSLGGRVFVPPSESGYLSLPFTGKADAAALARIAADFGAPVAEAVLSGPGLARVHRVLAGQARAPHDITARAPGTEASLALVLRVLGAYLGSLALAHLSYGGIYLAGSVGRALFRWCDGPDFTGPFSDRGAYRDIVTSMPLRLIENDSAALHGAALCLAQAEG